MKKITITDHKPRKTTLVIKMTINKTVQNSTPRFLLWLMARCGCSNGPSLILGSSS